MRSMWKIPNFNKKCNKKNIYLFQGEKSRTLMNQLILNKTGLFKFSQEIYIKKTCKNTCLITSLT